MEIDSETKYLVVPDVHGRDFWIKPVEDVLAETDTHIVFLGDYLDPYPYECEDGTDYRRVSIERFKEILELKHRNPNRITLLLGNHDFTYAFSTKICHCRTDWNNFNEIKELFNTNRNLFQIAKKVKICDKTILFSHAGILKEWAIKTFGESAENSDFNVVDQLNNVWMVEDNAVLYNFGIYDWYRGYDGESYASPVWSDIRSWANVTPEETYGLNIVGHTMTINKPVVLNCIIDLDCSRCFIIDNNGDLKDFNTDKKIVNLKEHINT